MMKHFLILVSALVLAQGLKKEEVISKNPFENGAEELLGPFLKEYFELNNLIEEVKQYQQTQKISSIALAEKIARVPQHCLPTNIQFVNAMDSDACNKLTNSLAEALSLAENIGSWAYQAGLKICGKFMDLILCNINLFTAIKCVLKEINDLEEIITGYKPDVLKFKEEIVALVKELKVEYLECIEAHKKAEAAAVQIVQTQVLNDRDL